MKMIVDPVNLSTIKPFHVKNVYLSSIMIILIDYIDRSTYIDLHMAIPPLAHNY